MNGRVYDPQIGRFLSADPFVQAPWFSQSFNRYSYVWNNPLSAIDPSGYEMVAAEAALLREITTSPTFTFNVTRGIAVTGTPAALAEPSPVGEVVLGAVLVTTVIGELAINIVDHFDKDFYEGLSDADLSVVNNVLSQSTTNQVENFYRGDSSGQDFFIATLVEDKGVSEAVSKLKNIDLNILTTNHAWGMKPSPFISVSSNRMVARHFALDSREFSSGSVYDLRIPSGLAIMNINNTDSFTHIETGLRMKEQEWLVPLFIPPHWVVNEERVR